MHQVGIGHGHGMRGGGRLNAKVDLLGACLGEQFQSDRAQQAGQVQGREIQGCCVAAPQGQQLLRAAGGAGNFGSQGLQCLLDHVAVGLSPCIVRLHLQSGQVGAQLMRCVVQKFSLLSDERLVARHVLVDGGHQGADVCG